MTRPDFTTLAAGYFLSEDDDKTLIQQVEDLENAENEFDDAIDYSLPWEPLEQESVETILEEIGTLEGDFNKVYQKFIEDLKIDWEQLRTQKDILHNMISDWGESDDPVQRAEAEKMNGVMNLIDSIQDFAVDVMGKDEKSIFNL